MTKKEVVNLIGLATANFPNMQDKDMRPTATLWEKMLSDLPYQLAEQALTKVLSTAKFFPTVADIREAAADISNPQIITAAEAWGQVKAAVSKYGHNRAQEALESLSPEVASMVRRFGFTEICKCEEIGVVRGQFIKLWDSQSKREKEMAVLPTHVRQLIQSTERKMLDA